jgi:hypothetical protein
MNVTKKILGTTLVVAMACSSVRAGDGDSESTIDQLKKFSLFVFGKSTPAPTAAAGHGAAGVTGAPASPSHKTAALILTTTIVGTTLGIKSYVWPKLKSFCKTDKIQSEVAAVEGSVQSLVHNAATAIAEGNAKNEQEQAAAVKALEKYKALVPNPEVCKDVVALAQAKLEKDKLEALKKPAAKTVA